MEQHIYDIYSRNIILPALPAEAFCRLRAIEDIDVVSIQELVQILLEMNLYNAGSTKNQIIDQCQSIIQNRNLYDDLVIRAISTLDEAIEYTRVVIEDLIDYKITILGASADTLVLCDRLMTQLCAYISRLETRAISLL